MTFEKLDEITDNIDKGLVPEPLFEPTEEDILELTKNKEYFNRYLPYLISVSTAFENNDIVMVINDIIDQYMED